MRIYEISGSRPYATATDCALDVRDRDLIVADCPHPSTLSRLELFMAGWTVRVNGKATTVRRTGEIFQAVDLPKGRSETSFAYVPPFISAGYAAALFGVVLLLAWTGIGSRIGRAFETRPAHPGLSVHVSS